MVTFEAVKKVVDSFDPMGLLYVGAPADEYWPECAELVQRVVNGEKFDAALLVDVFEKWFYEGAVSEELALAIVDRLHEQEPFC